MPKYHVVYQPNTSPSDEHRHDRSVVDGRATSMIVEAESVIGAVMNAEKQFPGLGLIPRVVAVEEMPPAIALLSMSDSQLTEALTSQTGDAEPFEVEDWDHETEPLDSDIDNLAYVADRVVCWLRDSGTIPGISLSLLRGTDSSRIDYTMIEIYDEARRYYISTGQDIEDLTTDCRAVGWPAILALTRGITAIAADLI